MKPRLMSPQNIRPSHLRIELQFFFGLYTNTILRIPGIVNLFLFS